MQADEEIIMVEPISEYDLMPFGGLFGDTHLARILAQIIADPFDEYAPKDLEELAEVSSPTVRKDLKHLTRLGILIKDSRDRRHPVYRVNTQCKRYLALTLLAYAVIDDRNGTNCMDAVIAEYYNLELKRFFEPSDAAVGNLMDIGPISSNASDLHVEQSGIMSAFDLESIPEHFAATA
ncbi:MAG: hypothetical protein QXI70_02975 [Methanothrix sp.]